MREEFEEHLALKHLRREWLAIAVSVLALTAAGYFVMRWAWDPQSALRWLASASVMIVYLFGSLWKRLPDNRLRTGDTLALFPTLGLANRITIARGVLSAWVAGFLFNPQPEGSLTWVPGLFFLAAVVTDFIDGYAARMTGRLTRLGEYLDMQWDSLAVLFAAFLLVRYGQVPPIYALVGLARYIYLSGIWIHTRLGGITGELPPSSYRRVLGGMQMGFIGAALLPIFSPPATQIASILFMTPVLAGFVRDFLAVTGIYTRPFAIPASYRVWLERVVPLALRAGLSVLLAVIAARSLGVHEQTGVLLVIGFALPAILVGAVGRLAALSVLLMAGIVLKKAPSDGLFLAIFLGGILLFMTGTGAYSLWKPEEWFIYHRAGEARG